MATMKNKKPKMTTKIPREITTPDSVKTRIGTLRFFDGFPTDDTLIEVKAVQEVLPIHKAQLLSYMKLLDIPIGLLINFHELKLTDGVHRLILPTANR